MTPQTRASLASLARRLDLEARLERYLPLAWDGVLEGGRPVLQLDDVSAIPFLAAVAGVELYQHRARMRCRDGHVFVAVSPAVDGYEEYCRENLRFGEPELVVAEPVGHLLEVARSAATGEAFCRIEARARHGRGMLIHPYMGHEAVWDLALKLADATGEHISVLAPPPPVTWIANDKRLLSDVVTIALGAEFLVNTRVSSDPETIASHLWDLVAHHEVVGLKRTRCASAMGNEVHNSRELAQRGPEGALDVVREFLHRTEWPEGEDVLAVVWEQTDVSPSTQLWIPPPEIGPPRLDGIYEQILDGPEKVFVGSRPSSLPAAVNRALGESALAVAECFQALGYVGRCSFDHLVVGDLEGDWRVLFTECNGRWGGTSTPMAMVDRLTGGQSPRPAYRAQDFVSDELVGARFVNILAAMRSHTFDPRTSGDGTFVFYNVGPLEPEGKLDVIAFGWGGQQEAEHAMEHTLPRLLGL